MTPDKPDRRHQNPGRPKSEKGQRPHFIHIRVFPDELEVYQRLGPDWVRKKLLEARYAELSSPIGRPAPTQDDLNHYAIWEGLLALPYKMLTPYQKLMAFAHRFYSHQVWVPQVGDFYTTTRNDMELYQIVKGDNDYFYTTHCDSKNWPETGPVYTQWRREGFSTQDFGICRLWIPDFILEGAN